MHRDCVQNGKGDEVSGGCGFRIKGMKRSGEVLKGHLTVRLTLLIVALIAYLNYVKFELSSQFTRICLIKICFTEDLHGIMKCLFGINLNPCT